MFAQSRYHCNSELATYLREQDLLDELEETYQPTQPQWEEVRTKPTHVRNWKKHFSGFDQQMQVMKLSLGSVLLGLLLYDITITLILVLPFIRQVISLIDTTPIRNLREPLLDFEKSVLRALSVKKLIEKSNTQHVVLLDVANQIDRMLHHTIGAVSQKALLFDTNILFRSTDDIMERLNVIKYIILRIEYVQPDGFVEKQLHLAKQRRQVDELIRMMEKQKLNLEQEILVFEMYQELVIEINPTTPTLKEQLISQAQTQLKQFRLLLKLIELGEAISPETLKRPLIMMTHFTENLCDIISASKRERVTNNEMQLQNPEVVADQPLENAEVSQEESNSSYVIYHESDDDSDQEQKPRLKTRKSMTSALIYDELLEEVKQVKKNFKYSLKQPLESKTKSKPKKQIDQNSVPKLVFSNSLLSELGSAVGKFQSFQLQELS